MKKILSVSVATLAMMIVGCGSDDTKTGQAYYIDSAVSGVNYTCGNQKGITGEDGSFVFEVGKSCTFNLGDMLLRAVDSTLLVDGAKIYETDIKIARILQSLDSDGDASNGITISASIIEALAKEGITSLPTTETELDVMLEVIARNGGREVSEAEAQAHLNATAGISAPVSTDTSKDTESANIKPKADAGKDQTMKVGETINLRGISSDEDGKITSNIWIEGTKVISDSKILNYTATKAGKYTLTFRVKDDKGVAVIDSMILTVTGETVVYEPISVIHNGTTYITVKSPHTDRVWLDRNLGASRVCQSATDTACYGDYYQWGRNFDGHQDSTSATTDVLATNVEDVGHGNFISTGRVDWAEVDTNGAKRIANWSKTDGSSICPIGFRVPNMQEWGADTYKENVTNNITAFNSFLKLSTAGRRNGEATIEYNTTHPMGFYYAINLPFDELFTFSTTFASGDFGSKRTGCSIRCIKN